MKRVNVYYRKDGRWEGRIPRGKRKDGKRKYQYVFAKTREDVVDKIAEIRRNEQNSGKCHKTVEALFDEWFVVFLRVKQLHYVIMVDAVKLNA